VETLCPQRNAAIIRRYSFQLTLCMDERRFACLLSYINMHSISPSISFGLPRPLIRYQVTPSGLYAARLMIFSQDSAAPQFSHLVALLKPSISPQTWRYRSYFDRVSSIQVRRMRAFQPMFSRPPSLACHCCLIGC
jgi:hypothetical protein